MPEFTIKNFGETPKIAIKSFEETLEIAIKNFEEMPKINEKQIEKRIFYGITQPYVKKAVAIELKILKYFCLKYYMKEEDAVDRWYAPKFINN